MVGKVGVEPTTPKGNGFTARRVCRFATYPYKPVGVNHGHCGALLQPHAIQYSTHAWAGGQYEHLLAANHGTDPCPQGSKPCVLPLHQSAIRPFQNRLTASHSIAVGLMVISSPETENLVNSGVFDGHSRIEMHSAKSFSWI